MKRNILVVLLTVLTLSLAFPQKSEANSGWWILPAFVGGMILGSAVTAPYGYAYPPPRPVYAYPPPHRVYVYPSRAYGDYPREEAYAYPEQGYTASPRYESPRGQWVIVPGQWVEGRWVPRHKAWAP